MCFAIVNQTQANPLEFPQMTAQQILYNFAPARQIVSKNLLLSIAKQDARRNTKSGESGERSVGRSYANTLRPAARLTMRRVVCSSSWTICNL